MSSNATGSWVEKSKTSKYIHLEAATPLWQTMEETSVKWSMAVDVEVT